MPPRLHPPPPIIDMSDNSNLRPVGDIHVQDMELTPELKNRVLDVQIKQEEKKLDHELEDNWNCCCIKNRPTDSRMIKYLFQMTIIIAIITICLIKLAQQNLPCEQANVYVGLISLLIGIVLPSPSSSKK